MPLLAAPPLSPAVRGESGGRLRKVCSPSEKDYSGEPLRERA